MEDMKRRNADETVRDLERQARAGDIDALERLLVESIRRDDRALSELVDDIAQVLGQRLIDEEKFREPGEWGHDKAPPLTPEAQRLIEIGVRSWEHRNRETRRRGERLPLKIAGKNAPRDISDRNGHMRRNGDGRIHRHEDEIARGDSSRFGDLYDACRSIGAPHDWSLRRIVTAWEKKVGASRALRDVAVFAKRLQAADIGRVPPFLRAVTQRRASNRKPTRANSDEELRRLERLALAGDDKAHDRYMTEARRRGISHDEAALALLRQAPDPAAFLGSEIGEDSRRAIKDKAESEIRAEANQKAAEGLSFHEEEDVWEIAWFGDATAVNGQLTRDGHGDLTPHYKTKEEADAAERHPENFEITNEGGRFPGGQEQEISVEWITEWTMRDLKLDEKNEALKDAVYKVIAKEFGSRDHFGESYVYWSSDDGDTEIWREVEQGSCDDCEAQGPLGEGRAIQAEASVRRPGEPRPPELCSSCFELRQSELRCAKCKLTGQPDGDVSFYDDPRVAGNVLCEDCYSLEIGSDEDEEPEPDEG